MTVSALFVILYVSARCYVSFLFSFYWYFFVYVRIVDGYVFCNGDRMDCIENVFVLCVFLLFLIFLFLFSWECLIVLSKEYWFGYFERADIDIISECNVFIENGRRYAVVFDVMQHVLAMIVCGFLAGNNREEREYSIESLTIIPSTDFCI